MKRILQASKDCYITNRIIRDSFRATDANVGQAGTLDIFKLAGESRLTFVTASLSSSVLLPGNGPFTSLDSGTAETIELSRVLLKFDLDPIRALTSSILDITDSSFVCELKLFDVMGGQPLPSNYSLVLYPLSRSFDEGAGRDVYSFEDLDATNFITASVSNGTPVTWSQSDAEAQVLAGSGALAFVGGASHLGYVGQELIDAVTGSMALGVMSATQDFSSDPAADLLMDITSIVSATLVGLLPDHGFRLSFIGSQETDGSTRFVKRFASRHSTNTRIRPRIEVGFNDSTQDNHENFYFDVTGSLFLNNFVRGVPTNITGSNSLRVTLTTGSLASGTLYSTSSVATMYMTGVYSTTFAISSLVTASLTDEIIRAHSATFTEIWSSLDSTVGYYTGSLVIYDFDRSAFVNTYDRLKINITNMKKVFRPTERMRFRVFAQDSGFNLKLTKKPIESKSIIFDKMYYRLRDVNTNAVIFDFDDVTDSTRMSSDSAGMYFDIYMSDLDMGRVYCIDVLIDVHGSRQIFESVGGSFRIDQ